MLWEAMGTMAPSVRTHNLWISEAGRQDKLVIQRQMARRTDWHAGLRADTSTCQGKLTTAHGAQGMDLGAHLD